MGDGTAIEWSDATWNVVSGWVKLHPERLDLPLRWRKPRRVFVDSMSDLFHDDVPDEFIEGVFGVMAVASHHTFQVLTKRPGRMASLLGRWAANFPPPIDLPRFRDDPGFPPPNVWLGTSVENQKWADVRIPKLLDTPAAVRFLSVEPLLGSVDLRWGGQPWRQWLPAPGPPDPLKLSHPKYIDWVIVGGESGPGARPMHPQWARDLRDQCVTAGVPLFMKQMGTVYSREHGGDAHGSDCIPEDLQYREYPDAPR